MAPLTDPERLEAYKDALRNWMYEGYIQFELTETSHRWIRRELDGITLKGIARLMWEYVDAGGEVDEVREKRPPWCDEYEFHHDLRFEIQGHAVYIETCLNYHVPVVPDDSSIVVVNIHDV